MDLRAILQSTAYQAHAQMVVIVAAIHYAFVRMDLQVQVVSKLFALIVVVVMEPAKQTHLDVTVMQGMTVLYVK